MVEAKKLEVRAHAESVLRELDRIVQWLVGVSQLKSDSMRENLRKLRTLYEQGQYQQVIDFGSAYIENPVGIQLNGKLSDIDELAPSVVDRANDTASGSPQGTDLTALYAIADVSNLYLAIRTMGDEPNTKQRSPSGSGLSPGPSMQPSLGMVQNACVSSNHGSKA